MKKKRKIEQMKDHWRRAAEADTTMRSMLGTSDKLEDAWQNLLKMERLEESCQPKKLCGRESRKIIKESIKTGRKFHKSLSKHDIQEAWSILDNLANLIKDDPSKMNTINITRLLPLYERGLENLKGTSRGGKKRYKIAEMLFDSAAYGAEFLIKKGLKNLITTHHGGNHLHDGNDDIVNQIRNRGMEIMKSHPTWSRRSVANQLVKESICGNSTARKYLPALKEEIELQEFIKALNEEIEFQSKVLERN